MIILPYFIGYEDKGLDVQKALGQCLDQCSSIIIIISCHHLFRDNCSTSVKGKQGPACGKLQK